MFVLHHHIGNQPLAPIPFSHRCDRSLSHTFVLRQRCLYFLQFPSVSLHLHLLILSTQKLDLSILQISPQVSSSIEPLSAHWMLDEALVRLFLVPPVSSRQPFSSDV